LRPIRQILRCIQSLFLLLAFLYFSCTSSASASINLEKIPSGALIGQYSYYLVDENSEFTFENLPEAGDHKWLPVDKDILSLGYASSTIWVRLVLSNPTNRSEWFLDIAYPVLDNVDIHIQYADKTEKYALGDSVVFDARPIEHRNFVVPVSLEPNASAAAVFRVSSGTSLQIPIKIWEQKLFHESEQRALVWQGIYFGCILIMTFYNLCLFYYIREKKYIYYASTFGSFILFQATISGVSYQFLWPHSPQWNEHALPIFVGLVLLSECMFMRSLLDLKLRSPKIDKFLYICSIISVLLIVLSAVLPYRQAIICMIVLVLPINAVGFIIGIKQWLEGSKAAQLFTVAWTGTLFGAVLLALSKLGFVERNFFTENALQIGTMISVLWLSFALGEYIAQQTRERQKAKQDALEYALRIAQERKEKLSAQEATLVAQKRSNEELEIIVKQRTEQLEQANSKLKRISNLDELTGIFNRRYFNKNLKAEFKRSERTQQPLSVIIVDVDHFKNINDSYGHLAGDACLKAVARVLKDGVTRPSDTLSRFGGEEFIILLPNTPTEGAFSVAERLLSTVENERVHFEELTLKMTVSIGITTTGSSDIDTPEKLIAKADVALYSAKGNGRNCIVESV